MTDNTAAAAARFSVWPYIGIAVAIGGFALLSNGYGGVVLERLAALEEAPTAPGLAALLLFAGCSFVSFYTAQNTPLPSFVVALALGIAGHNFFAPIVANQNLLATLVTASAAIILFGGGLEMPFKAFLRLSPKIVLLAVPGVILTGLAFSWTLGQAAGPMGVALGAGVVILLGAILASTDPAAIIPVLQHLRFKRRDTKDIVVAESALNDVVGALLTTAFLKIPLAGLTVGAAYMALAKPETYAFLGRQAGFGLLAGLGGFVLLRLLAGMKRRHSRTNGADNIYFLAVPVLAFVAAAAFGGSGFLAAFIAGLLFHVEEHLREVEHFFNQVIDGLAKPVIFLLVGALVDVRGLIAFAPIGIAAALVFMFVLRPAMVFLMLGVFRLLPSKAGGLSYQELLFISAVRETGAIPAVLLVTVITAGHGTMTGLVEIGMWVILLTLVLAPPLTPWIARRLGVAE